MVSVLHKAQWVAMVSSEYAKVGIDVLHVHKRRHRLDMIGIIQKICLNLENQFFRIIFFYTFF